MKTYLTKMRKSLSGLVFIVTIMSNFLSVEAEESVESRELCRIKLKNDLIFIGYPDAQNKDFLTFICQSGDTAQLEKQNISSIESLETKITKKTQESKKSFNNTDINLGTGSFPINVGLSYNFYLSEFTIGIAYMYNSKFPKYDFLVSESNHEYMHNIGVTFGLCKTVKKFYGSFSSGLGIVSGSNRGTLSYATYTPIIENVHNNWNLLIANRKYYNNEKFTEFNIPFELKLMFRPRKNFGIGCLVHADVNSMRNTWNAGLVLSFGKFK